MMAVRYTEVNDMLVVLSVALFLSVPMRPLSSYHLLYVSSFGSACCFCAVHTAFPIYISSDIVIMVGFFVELLMCSIILTRFIRIFLGCLSVLIFVLEYVLFRFRSSYFEFAEFSLSSVIVIFVAAAISILSS